MGARVLPVVLACIASSLGATDLPFIADFEAPDFTSGFLISDPDWSFNSESLTVEVVDADSISPNELALGSQSLTLTGVGDLTLETNDELEGQVRWVDFYVKPVFVDQADLSFSIGSLQSAVSAFAIDGSVDGSVGQVYAVDGDGAGSGMWVAAGVPITLSGETSSEWVRLTYRIDYTNKRWDLFINNQLVLVDLGFLDDEFTQLNQVDFSADETTATGLDHFYAGDLSQVDLDGDGVAEVDADNDGIADFYEVANGMDALADDRQGDIDHDSVSNIDEYFGGLLAGSADSDGDGVHDGQELRMGNDPIVTDAYSLNSIPFVADFETPELGSIDGVNLWSVESGTATVQTSEVASGTQAVELAATSEEALLTNHFDGSAYAQVWIDFQIKPVFWGSGDGPDVSEFLYAPFGVFYFNENSTVTYLNGDGQGRGTWETTAVALDSAQWQRVTLYNDYAAQTWSLWLNGVRVAQNIGFAHPQPYFNHLAFQQGDEAFAYLDDLTAGTAESATLDNDGDTLTNDFERTNSSYGFDLDNASDGDLDVDDDGLGTAQELALGTSFDVSDTDTDGLLDGVEVFLGEDPMVLGSYNALIDNGSGVYTWSTDFEVAESYSAGALDGQGLWRANIAEASVSTSVSQSGSQALALSSAGTEPVIAEQILVTPESETTVWVSFQAQLNSGELPELVDSSTLGAFIMTRNSAGNLAVLDGSDLSWIDTGLTLADATWVRFDCRLDYTAKTWDLYVDYVLIQEDVSFVNPNLPVLSAIQFEQDQRDDEVNVAYIDALQITNVMPQELLDWSQVPDEWKLTYFGDLTQTGSDNYDGDDYDNITEFINGSNPADYYNFDHSTLAVLPVLSVLSGGEQTQPDEGPLTLPIILEVKDQNGAPLVNAPVYLTSEALDALFDTDADPTDGGMNPITLLTDALGQVTVYFQP
jgi:hypothetical protein